MSVNAEQTYRKRLLRLISWGHWFTFFNIIAAIVIAVLFVRAESLPETVLGQLYLVLTWISHMGFLVFMCFIFTVFPVTLLFPRTRFIRAIASIIFTFSLTLLIFDGIVYAELGYHLNAASLAQVSQLAIDLWTESNQTFWQLGGVVILLVLAFELTVSNYAWKHLRQLQQSAMANKIVAIFVACFVLSHILHIRADVDLNYDILKQDTQFPLSYPATAKTLLTKYGFIDKEDYLARRNKPLAITQADIGYPKLTNVCQVNQPAQSVVYILNDIALSTQQIQQFSQRASSRLVKLTRHTDSAKLENAWFNLFYGLPTVYKQAVLPTATTPLLNQLLAASGINTELTVIYGANLPQLPSWLVAQFAKVNFSNEITDHLNDVNQSSTASTFRVFFFSGATEYQFELFVDAFMLAQKNKPAKDLIYVSSVGNLTVDSQYSVKPSLLLNSRYPSMDVSAVTNHIDINGAVLSSLTKCEPVQQQLANNHTLDQLDNNRIIANTIDDGIMVFSKDKSVLVDQNGNFQSYSSQLNTLITEKSDYPLLIDGVKYIKRFEQTLSVQ